MPTTIKLSPDGKVYLNANGKPTCVCCDAECAEQTSICVTINDYGVGSQDITLTGSLNGGSFTGVYDPCGAAYPVELQWDGTAWVFIYDGNTLPSEIGATYTAALDTARCNPVGMTIYYEDSFIIVEVEVLSFGPCPCPCDPNYTSIYADLYDGPVFLASIEFIGSLCSGEFFCDEDSSFLRWTGCEWVWDTASVEYPADPPITGRCAVATIGGTFTDSVRILTITGAA